MSFNNQPCQFRPTHIDGNSLNPFIAHLLLALVSVVKAVIDRYMYQMKKENVNLKVFNLIPWIKVFKDLIELGF